MFEKLEQLAKEMGPWIVNGPAQTVAIAALSDTLWQSNMRTALAGQSLQQRNIWKPAMAALGAYHAGSHELFRSFSMAPKLAKKLHQSAAKNGILIRLVTIDSNTSLLRFGNVGLSQNINNVSALEYCHTWIQQAS